MDFGAVGDGVTDDQAALQVAANSGKLIFIDRTYACGSQIVWNVDGGGFIGGNANSKILMLTGTGKFTNTDDSTRFASNSCLIYIYGRAGVRVENIQFTLGGSPSNDSVCFPIAIRLSSNVKVLGNNFYGFRKTDGIVTIDTSNDCAVRGNFFQESHCLGAAYGQLTGVSVDDVRIGDAASNRLDISYNRFKNLGWDLTFLAANGPQTDGIAIQHPDSQRHTIIGNCFDSVGEGIDLFGGYCVVAGNNFDSCYGHAIKIIHGAQRNNVGHNVCNRCGRIGIIISGSNSSGRATEKNYIHDNTVTRTNDLGAWPGTTCGIAAEDSNFTHKARDNTFADNIVDDSPNCDYGVVDENPSTPNRWFDNDIRGTFGSGEVADTGGTMIFRSRLRSYVEAYRSSTQTIPTGTATTIVFNAETKDTKGEYDPATGVFTAKHPCKVVVEAKVRTAGAVSGNLWRLYVIVNGAPKWTEQVVPASTEFAMSISGVFELRAGHTLYVQLAHDKGSNQDITGDAEVTLLQIHEV